MEELRGMENQGIGMEPKEPGLVSKLSDITSMIQVSWIMIGMSIIGQKVLERMVAREVSLIFRSKD